MAVSSPADARLLALEDVATQLRVDSVRATTAAGSGHPTSCASGADLVAAIFFDVMRFDPQAPRDPACDRFVLSKGHAAPAGRSASRRRRSPRSEKHTSELQ